MFKIRFILFLSMFVFFNTVTSQSIRKNYNEMTQSEKDELINAFIYLKDSLINDLAVFHDLNFDLIHFNLSGEDQHPELDVFFAWHRYQMLTLENAMQKLNSKISIPFWNWTIAEDRLKSGPLWDSSFMGIFGTGEAQDWGLGRSESSTYLLPTTAHVNNVQDDPYTNNASLASRRVQFQNYSANVENNRVHVGGHIWTGGVMAEANSPADPIFYLHHAMVDKLWQDWIEANNITTADDIYINTSLPNWPSIDPDDIVDSKTIGVFYADETNDLAILHDYSVTNNHLSEEVFYYQYTIEAKDNFIIPSGKTAKIESVNDVILKPGFHADDGSSFIAKIDIDNDILTNKKSLTKFSQKNTDPLWSFRIVENIYIERDLNPEVDFILYPREKDKLGFEFKNECSNCKIEILDSKDNIILNRTLSSGKKLDIDLQPLIPGTHALNISINDNYIMTKELLKL